MTEMHWQGWEKVGRQNCQKSGLSALFRSGGGGVFGQVAPVLALRPSSTSNLHVNMMSSVTGNAR
jgi:hypothetical protein